MSDARAKKNRDRPPAARAARGEAALVAQYIHDLSDRHNGNGATRPSALDREGAARGAGGEEGG
jgi:hypothetical protein